MFKGKPSMTLGSLKLQSNPLSLISFTVHIVILKPSLPVSAPSLGSVVRQHLELSWMRKDPEGESLSGVCHQGARQPRTTLAHSVFYLIRES